MANYYTKDILDALYDISIYYHIELAPHILSFQCLFNTCTLAYIYYIISDAIICIIAEIFTPIEE